MDKLCECGCGLPAPVASRTEKSRNWVKGQPIRFIRGHCGKILKQTQTHGMSNSHIYKVWSEMIQRCENPNNKSFEYYGGRGISVCDRWHKFENFLSDMGTRPSKKHSLDRINNNGNYEPSNVEWNTVVHQNNNQIRNRVITFNGESKTLAQWSRLLSMKYSTLSARINSYKWSVEKSFLTPVK